MTYTEYDSAIQMLVDNIKQGGRTFRAVMPIPRGGYYPGIRVAEALGVKIVTEPADDVLVVDDLAGSGMTISKYSSYATAVVYLKKRVTVKPTFHGKVIDDEWIHFPDEHDCGIEEHIRRMFEFMGENPDRDGLVDTPDRIIRMWKEVYRGYDPSQKPKITVFANGKDGMSYEGMIVDTGDFYSMCEHHVMPFFGKYYFAYIPHPQGKVLGLSKIGKVVDYCSARLQMQERLVREIVDMLEEALDCDNPPLGMALMMKGHHLCKEMRGARKKGEMVSSHVTGVFRNPDIHAQFLMTVEAM